MRDRRPDQAVTRHALRRVRRLKKASDRLSNADKKALTEWESEFLDGVETRLDTYGSAFADPNLGDEEEALSVRQEGKLREVRHKVRRMQRRARADIEENDDGAAKKGQGTKPSRKPFATKKPHTGPKRQSGLKRTPLKRKTPFRRGPKTDSGDCS